MSARTEVLKRAIEDVLASLECDHVAHELHAADYAKTLRSALSECGIVVGKEEIMIGYTYNAMVLRVVDGDTLDVDVDLGFRAHMTVRVRLLRVNTPEVYGVPHDSEEYAKGKQASAIVEDWVASQPDEKVIVATKMDKTGKYGRWLAEVLPVGGGQSLNEVLCEHGWGES